MDKRVIFLIFLLNVIYVWSSPRMVHIINKREIFCGNKLSDALALVCRGNYQSPSKKSMNDLLGYEYGDLPTENEEENEFDFPFVPKEAANSFLPTRYRRRSKGIVYECCHNPCSYKHLSLYCA